MGYCFSRTVAASQQEAIDPVTAALANKGFGILTTIDVAATIKAKLGLDFRPYMILGACNSHFSWRALQAEDKIVTMPPCNVIVSKVSPGATEIAAVDAVTSIPNPKLADLAEAVRCSLREIVEAA